MSLCCASFRSVCLGEEDCGRGILMMRIKTGKHSKINLCSFCRGMRCGGGSGIHIFWLHPKDCRVGPRAIAVEGLILLTEEMVDICLEARGENEK